MSARVGATNLDEAVKELSRHWDRTRSSWRDAKAHEFQRTYLDKLPQVLMRAKTIMEETDTVLRRIHKDCE
jgi:hypothetical protein